MKNNLRIVFILIVAIIYFAFAVFFIYTSDSSGEEEMYFAKVREVYQSKFSLSNIDAYDFGLLALLFPFKLFQFRLIAAAAAFLGIIVLMILLFKRKKYWEGLFLGLLISLNPITVYYLTKNEKWSILFLGLSIFLFIYLDRSIKKIYQIILGILILAILSLMEKVFVFLLIGFVVFLALQKIKKTCSKTINIPFYIISSLVLILLVFFSFRILNRDLFIESDFSDYLLNYFPVILLGLLLIFSGKVALRKSLLFMLAIFTFVPFFISSFEPVLFKISFLPIFGLFISIHLKKILETKSKRFVLTIIIILLLLSPFSTKKVGDNLLFWEESKKMPIKSFSELGNLIKAKTSPKSLIFSVYPSFALEANRQNLPEIIKCQAEINYKKRCPEQKQVEILKNYLLQGKKIDAIIFLEEDIKDYPEIEELIKEKYILSKTLPLYFRKMDKALVYLSK